ncbi:MAG: hypothetical protein WCG42_05890 [Parachlamydiaceae bacterium]
MKLVRLSFMALCAIGAAAPNVHLGAVTLQTADATEIAQAVSTLNQYAATQSSLGIQNSDLAYAMRKAFVLSDLLLTADGQLQTNLCPALAQAFVPQHPLNYEVDIANVLSSIDATWQPFFDQVHAPVNPNNASNKILRAFFGLPANQVITDRDAKVALLAALFAPYNQGPVGDCFAVSGLIRDHDEHIKHTATDLAEIINNGYITRIVNASPDNFFFPDVIADTDTETTFTLNTSGNINGTNISFLNAPGFAAASNVMGGGQVPQLQQAVLQFLFNGNLTGQVQVTPQQLVNAVAQVIAKNVAGSNQAALYAQGLYAFSSLTNNPLLRAQECAFAAMAEDRTQDYIRGSINQSVAQALKSTWGGAKLSVEASNFQKAFVNNFNAAFRIIYNPSIPLPQVAADGSSSAGGFQLYRRVLNDPTQIGTQVVTPQDLRQFILDVLTATEASLTQTSTLQALSNRLATYIHTDAFLTAVFYAYDSANKSVANPVANYLTLSSTPMQSCDGDNPYEVDDIDSGINHEAHVVTHTPTNTQDLLTWCLGLAKTSAQMLFPMDSPQHAFNFDPTNPDIAAFLKSGLTSDVWIRQQMIVPSMKVATRTIDPTTRTNLANAMYAVLEQLVSEYDYQAMVNQLAKKTLTVQGFAQQLLSGIHGIVWLNSNQSAELALILDANLVKALPASDQQTLQQAAVRFAFTNWNDGTKDIYFCAFLNPRTTQISFASIDEDKTNLYPMDEVAWVNNQRWDVDLSLDDPANTFVALAH